MNFKIFSKELFSISLDNYNLFTSKLLHVELNTMLMVLVEFVLDMPKLYSRLSEYLTNLADSHFTVCRFVKV